MMRITQEQIQQYQDAKAQACRDYLASKGQVFESAIKRLRND